MAGTHSADVSLNILARRAEPEVPSPVATPTSLELTLLPLADCARYDGLRPPPPRPPPANLNEAMLMEAVHGAA